MSGFEFITEPELYGAIPEPEPAHHMLPDWYKNLPIEVDGGVERSGLRNSTVRACMPFLEAMKMGWILKTPADIEIRCGDGEFEYQSLINREVMNTFSHSQLGPQFPERGYIINFYSHWRMEAPDGWSILTTHPLNRPGEDRFRAFSGVLDVDEYDAALNQPSIFLKESFSGVIPQGTPISQIIPIHRDWLDMEATARPATEDEELAYTTEQNSNAANQRNYRDDVWEPIDGARVDAKDLSE